MNYNHVPQLVRYSPASLDVPGQFDQPYRGGYGPEGPPESPLRGILLKVVHLALKNKILIGVFLGLGLFAGFYVTYTTPKVFSATTTIKIDRTAPRVLNSQREEPINSESGFIQTNLELIKSRELADRVARAMNLAQSDFVGSPQSPGLFARITGRSGGEQQLNAAQIELRHNAAVGMIMGGLSATPVGNTSLVRIRYASTSPEWAQRISVGVAEQFERSTLDRRFSSSRYARAFLEERLQQLKIKLQESERQLIEYAQKNGIVNVDDKQPQASANLQAIQSAFTAASTERLKLEQLWQQASTGNALSLPQVINDKSIQTSRERLAVMRANYQEKLATLKPAFPEMVALRTQMNEVEKQVRDQVEIVRASIKGEYEAALAQEKAFAAKLEEVKAEVLELRGRSVDYTILQREVDTSRSLYEGLLQQFRELGVAGDVDTNNVSIIDRALVPGGHDSPSLRRNLMISLLLSLIGAAGVITIRDALDDTFKSAEDLEEALGLPVLGVTPKNALEASTIDVVLTDPSSALAEAYRSLRTALQFSTEDGAPKTLVVTSSQPGEGKTTTAACLALKFAQLGQRVLLIDADLRNPSVHRTLELENECGLSNYLAGSSDTSQMVKGCRLPGVIVMTSGPMPPNPAELLAGPRFATLLTTASETFDIVLIDAPPVMGLADTPIISSVAAGTIIVVEAGVTRRALIRNSLKRLDFARARLLGAVLNKFDVKRAGYKYASGHYGNGLEGIYDYRARPAPDRLTAQ